jgi:phosphoglycerol transferase MdoB-like AlkP superfamily enzyme
MMDYYTVRPTYAFSIFFINNINNPVYIYEGILIGALLVGLFLLTNMEHLSVTITSILLFFLTYTSYIKYTNRKELLFIGDLKLTEAAGMALNYLNFSYNWRVHNLLMPLILFCLAFFFLGRLRKKLNLYSRQKSWKYRIVRMFILLLVVFVMTIYSKSFFTSMAIKETFEPTTTISSQKNMYVLYRFLQNGGHDDISMDDVESSYEYILSNEGVSDCTISDYPNIIVIMNESWWNTDNITSDDITFSSDPMQPYKDLDKLCVTGYLTSNVFGGGTVSSETEFLTGLNTKYYVGTANFYNTTKDRKFPSIVDYFDQLGYDTVAIHPYYGYFYSRDEAYPKMGFEKTVFADDMLYRDIYSKYISDESLAKQIIYEYEQESENSKFIWAVSIANHLRTLDYECASVEDYDYPITVSVKNGNLSDDVYSDLTNSINGIYYANLAFGTLVDYFEAVDEPTIILMFGDHIPLLFDNTLSLMGINGDDPNTLERQYSVPCILWSNIDNADLPVFSGEGIYYLPQMLLEYAGLPDTNMRRILRYERKFFKADSRAFVLSPNGLPLSNFTQEQISGLTYYKAVEYDLIRGDLIGNDVWNPIW